LEFIILLQHKSILLVIIQECSIELVLHVVLRQLLFRLRRLRSTVFRSRIARL